MFDIDPLLWWNNNYFSYQPPVEKRKILDILDDVAWRHHGSFIVIRPPIVKEKFLTFQSHGFKYLILLDDSTSHCERKILNILDDVLCVHSKSHWGLFSAPSLLLVGLPCGQKKRQNISLCRSRRRLKYMSTTSISCRLSERWFHGGLLLCVLTK